jgi:hypothetical protein
MSLHDHRGPAPDFTDAFLCTLCVIVFVGLCTIAAVAGYVWVVITACLLDRGITWLDRYKN